MARSNVPTTVILRSRIPQIIAEMEPKTGLAVGAGARLIRDAAKENLVEDGTIRTGNLRDSIHVTRRGTTARVIAGNKDVFYGHLVERGTATGSPAQPFMVPAAEEMKDEVVELIAATLRTL